MKTITITCTDTANGLRWDSKTSEGDATRAEILGIHLLNGLIRGMCQTITLATGWITEAQPEVAAGLISNKVPDEAAKSAANKPPNPRKATT